MSRSDADRDREEIARRTRLRSEEARFGRAITPIVIPLRDNSTTADMVDLAARVKFDADGSGLRKTWTWISKDAAWLLWRPKSTRPVNASLQLFGDVTFWLFWEIAPRGVSFVDGCQRPTYDILLWPVGES